MTDRIHSITLVLEQDMRVAESRVRRDLEEKLWKVLK